MTPAAFTSPIGVHFPAGTVFVVNLVGVSTRCHAERCGSIAWVSDGCFLTSDLTKGSR